VPRPWRAATSIDGRRALWSLEAHRWLGSDGSSALPRRLLPMPLAAAQRVISETDPTLSERVPGLEVDVRFDPLTYVSTLEVSYPIAAPPAQARELIDPLSWPLQPFFVETQWRHVDELDTTTGACRGQLYEHLDFTLDDVLLRSCENVLYVEYSGLGPEPRHPCRIDVVYSLWQSIGDLFTIDVGSYGAESEDESLGRWLVRMRKDIRFAEPANNLFAPMFLSFWELNTEHFLRGLIRPREIDLVNAVGPNA
jgi:hypothetical protein